MHTQDAATAGLQRLIIAEGLGADQRAEGHAFGRDIDILFRVGDDLDEEAGVRAALVELTRGVLEARAKASGNGTMRLLTDGDAHALKRVDHLLVAGEIGIDGKVVARGSLTDEALEC